MELLVSLGIIIIIGLAFSMILSQSRQVVSATQALIRANSAASAIAQVIRDDFVGLSKEGFLAIPDPTHLVFTATGIFKSQDPATPNLTANAGVIDYGLDPVTHILWRRARPLSGTTGIMNVGPYSIDAYLGQFRYGGTAVNPPDYTVLPANLPTPPNYPVSTVGNIWPVLATECTSVTVQWMITAGTWQSPTTTAPGLWTYADIGSPTNPWPKAVKVTFRLRTGDKANDTMDYEVICSIR